MQSFSVKGQRSIQKDKGIRATNTSNRDRGNIETEVTFEVTRLWPDQNAAETFVLMHDTMMPPANAMVLITFTAGQPGKLSNRYLQGTLETQNSVSRGMSTIHNYKIVGPSMTATPPS